MFSPETVAILTFFAVFMFVLWNFFAKESKYNNFLKDKLKVITEEEKQNKSSRQLKIEKSISDLNTSITYKKLIFYSYFFMVFFMLIFIVLEYPLFGVLFAIISFKLPEITLSLLKDRKLSKFKEQLPDAIAQLLAILQSNQTLLQGFKLLSEELPYPIGDEFKKLYTEINTGASMESALMHFYERVPINDIKLFMIGLVVSEKATTTVAINTLKTISSTIRERDSQKKSAQTAIASGKYTAIVLSALPIFMFVAIESFMPAYMNDFLELTIGKIAIVGAFVLDFIGYMIAKKITNSSNIVKY